MWSNDWNHCSFWPTRLFSNNLIKCCMLWLNFGILVSIKLPIDFECYWLLQLTYILVWKIRKMTTNKVEKENKSTKEIVVNWPLARFAVEKNGDNEWRHECLAIVWNVNKKRIIHLYYEIEINMRMAPELWCDSMFKLKQCSKFNGKIENDWALRNELIHELFIPKSFIIEADEWPNRSRSLSH